MGAQWSTVIRNSLQDITIDDVVETGEEIGRGAYGEVVVVRVNGLRCASKRLHPALLDSLPFEINHVARRFIDECQYLSKLHHPNIVQFLGVSFIGDTKIPSIVMELLPTNLSTFLDEYTNVPTYAKHSILYDVAVGLLYLHTRTPPIIHRDLATNNVLLTHGLKAKIADLGVARTLPPRTASNAEGPLQTLAPGNLSYMPPEARQEVPSYDTKLDVFSFGHLIIHVVLQKWPMILDEYYYPYNDDQELRVYRTELQRRQRCLDEIIDYSEQLHTLARMCLVDEPAIRPSTVKVVEEMSTIASQTPPPFSTPMDILGALEAAKEVKMLQEKLAERKKVGEAMMQRAEEKHHYYLPPIEEVRVLNK